jgi:hypothetical protein
MYSNDKVLMRYTSLCMLIITLAWPLATEVQAALDATRWWPSQAEVPVW